MRPLRSIWFWLLAAFAGLAMGAVVAYAAQGINDDPTGRPAGPVDFSTPLTIISALNQAGYICLDPTKQPTAEVVEYRCEHDGDPVAVVVGGAGDAAARQAAAGDDLDVSTGEGWSVRAPSTADAAQIRAALGL